MTAKSIIIDGVDVSKCKYFNCDSKECKAEYYIRYGYEIVECDSCIENPNCYFKQLKLKEQECEGLKKDLHKNFEEKDKLHLIIDRLLEASGYDTNTASAEDFEDVYKNMRYEKQQLDQLKAENEKLKKQVCGLRPELKSIIDKTCCKYNIEAKYYHEKIVEIINNLDELKQTLTEIKNIAKEKANVNDWLALEILQKISECEVDNG